MIRYTAIALILALGIGYLSFWPVPIAPVAWEPPEDPGFTGVFAENSRLEGVEVLALNPDEHGPEDIAVDGDGTVWTTSAEGGLYRMEQGGDLVHVGHLGNRPLGLEPAADGGLYIADSFVGLLHWSLEGGTRVLVDEVRGQPLRYANQLAVASDGRVFFSVSTTRFDPQAYGGTLEASILDLLEHRQTGYVAVYTPEGEVEVIAEGFSFTNGVALTPAEDALLIAETGTYAIWKHWLEGPKAGTREKIVETLPGFPDNIQAQGDGTFWVGLVSPRPPAPDMLAPFPAVRRLVMRLPESVRPAPIPYAALVRIDSEGTILDVPQDPSGVFALTTGARIVGDHLIISSLGARGLGRLPIAALDGG
ncbi:MAG: SMP-30/gluconolactonase/LRE family protein [Pseudomonadota bacterium]